MLIFLLLFLISVVSFRHLHVHKIDDVLAYWV